MAAARRTRAEMKAATRERLLAAAAKVIARKGFHRTSLDDIAAAAGVTKGAIYSNFGSKNELILEAADRVIMQPIMTVGVEAASYEEHLVAGARELSQRVDRAPQEALLSIELGTYLLRDPKYRREMHRRGKLAETHGTGPADDLTRFGLRTSVPPEYLGVALNAVSVGLAFYRLIYGAEQVPDELFDWVFSLMASGAEPVDASGTSSSSPSTPANELVEGLASPGERR